MLIFRRLKWNLTASFLSFVCFFSQMAPHNIFSLVADWVCLKKYVQICVSTAMYVCMCVSGQFRRISWYICQLKICRKRLQVELHDFAVNYLTVIAWISLHTHIQQDKLTIAISLEGKLKPKRFQISQNENVIWSIYFRVML